MTELPEIPQVIVARPWGYGSDDKRSFGFCGRCGHHGSDCKCSITQYVRWQAEQESKNRVRDAAPTMLAALKEVEGVIYSVGAPLGSDQYFKIRTAIAGAIAMAEGKP